MEMVLTVAVVLALALVGAVIFASETGAGRARFTDYPDEISTAAFRFVAMPSLWPSYLGGDLKQIAEREALIARRRREAESLPSKELRECVLAWLRYYERKLPEERDELVNRTSRKKLDRYNEEQRVKQAKVAEILRQNNVRPR